VNYGGTGSCRSVVVASLGNRTDLEELVAEIAVRLREAIGE
jgi:hypothetical protein